MFPWLSASPRSRPRPTIMSHMASLDAVMRRLLQHPHVLSALSFSSTTLFFRLSLSLKERLSWHCSSRTAIAPRNFRQMLHDFYLQRSGSQKRSSKSVGTSSATSYGLRTVHPILTSSAPRSCLTSSTCTAHLRASVSPLRYLRRASSNHSS